MQWWLKQIAHQRKMKMLVTSMTVMHAKEKANKVQLDYKKCALLITDLSPHKIDPLKKEF